MMNISLTCSVCPANRSGYGPTRTGLTHSGHTDAPQPWAANHWQPGGSEGANQADALRGTTTLTHHVCQSACLLLLLRVRWSGHYARSIGVSGVLNMCEIEPGVARIARTVTEICCFVCK